MSESLLRGGKETYGDCCCFCFIRCKLFALSDLETDVLIEARHPKLFGGWIQRGERIVLYRPVDFLVGS